MSVIMSGIEMPKSCHKCFIKQGSCPAIRKRIQVLPANGDIWVPYNYRHDDCPLGDVPTPHGKLIDKDALLAQFMEMSLDDLSLAEDFIEHGIDDVLDDAPTIIEADG